MKEFYELPTTYIECDCHTELLQLVFEEEKENPELNFLYISFYRNFVGELKIGWKSKLQHIWYIIKHGVPWADQIMLRTEEIIKLKEYLNNLKLDGRKLESVKYVDGNGLRVNLPKVPSPPETRKIEEDIHPIKFIKNLFKGKIKC